MEVGSYITHFFSEMDSVELMLDIKKKKILWEAKLLKL